MSIYPSPCDSIHLKFILISCKLEHTCEQAGNIGLGFIKLYSLGVYNAYSLRVSSLENRRFAPYLCYEEISCVSLAVGAWKIYRLVSPPLSVDYITSLDHLVSVDVIAINTLRCCRC